MNNTKIHPPIIKRIRGKVARNIQKDLKNANDFKPTPIAVK